MRNYNANTLRNNTTSVLRNDNFNNSISSSVGLNATNNPSDVQAIQSLLKNYGYPLQTNGQLNNNNNDPTILSILNFQSNNNTRITGLIEPNDTTFTLLKNIVNTPNSLQESEDESLHQPFSTNAYFFRRNANNANTLNVIFEGDSWLDYPIPRVLDLYDTISERNQRLNLNSLHLAKFGETTSNMFNDKADFNNYISNYRIDRIYFSGGGNDVFPQLANIVAPRTTHSVIFSDMTKLHELQSMTPGDELFKKCIDYKRYLNTQAFDSAMFNSVNLNSIFQTIKNNYLGFGSIINANCTPNLIFYMHTYDYPMFKLGTSPTIGGLNLPLGPWIEPAFIQLGINDPILRCFIIIRLLDKFYNLLTQIKNQFNALNYQFQTRIIDFRGLLNSSIYWRDEIHPNSDGSRRLATRVNF